MPANSLKVSQLLAVSTASFDEELSAFKFRRVAPVAIYIDAGRESRRLGQAIAQDAKAILQELGYGETFQWGSFQGSYVILNLHEGAQPEDRPTFVEKMGQARDRIARTVADRLGKFPWKRAGNLAVGGVKVAVAVGATAVLIHAAPVTITIGTFVVPAKAWLTLQVVEKGIRAVEAVKGMFVESPPAVKALQQATPQTLGSISSRDLEKAYGDLFNTFKQVQAFDETFKDKLMTEDDLTRTNDALTTLRSIVEKWKGDSRAQQDITMKPIRIKKKT